MPVRLYNTRTRQLDDTIPLNDTIRMYSCGPTVYDYVHIGNLSAFITADILRRTLAYNNQPVKHVMNFTDVDDKTIRRSRENYPDQEPMIALQALTQKYGDAFLDDMQAVGNDITAIDFIKATDKTVIVGMQALIEQLYTGGFAYIADDGVYFNIAAYKKSGKIYGQLVELTESNTSAERIQNDEYDKDSAHDFALWKTQKSGEPAWDFVLDGHTLTGRPGWHIECSVMSRQGLGQPFDIHTGGIDLAFPHHENEIAQSTATSDDPLYANVFVHNEHILVDGKKMSKSLGNFYTLRDLVERGVDPLAFRLLVLQSHYRKPTNFSFDDVAAASNRLHHWRQVAALRHQLHDTINEANQTGERVPSLAAVSALAEALQNDLDTPTALKLIDQTFAVIEAQRLSSIDRQALIQLLEAIDELLGVQLLTSTPDISEEQKRLILERQRARDEKDWAKSDELRSVLSKQGILLRDTADGSIWQR